MRQDFTINHRSLEKSGIIVQARVGSTRLPGKALLKLGNTDIIGYIVQKLLRHSSKVKVILASPSSHENDVFRVRAQELNCLHFAGDEQDVLSRYYECAMKYGLSTIVRLTSDNPFVPAKLVYEMVDSFVKSPTIDYLSTTLDCNSPIGLHVEVFSFNALQDAYSQSNSYPLAREHVTPFIYNNPDLYTCRAYRASSMPIPYRITVDYIEDLKFARLLAERLSHIQDPTLVQIVNSIEQPFSLASVNSMHKKTSTSPLQ